MMRFFLFIILTACMADARPLAPKEIDNRKVIEQFYSSVQKQEYKTIDSLVSHDYQVMDIGALKDNDAIDYSKSLSDINKRTRLLHRALPGFALKIEEIVASDDKVMVRTKLIGEQKGTFLGVAPTGKPIVLRNFVEFTLKEGKITRIVELWNELSVMRQMGVIILN